MMRQAISPRLAIRIRLNMRKLPATSPPPHERAGSYAICRTAKPSGGNGLYAGKPQGPPLHRTYRISAGAPPRPGALRNFSPAIKFHYHLQLCKGVTPEGADVQRGNAASPGHRGSAGQLDRIRTRTPAVGGGNPHPHAGLRWLVPDHGGLPVRICEYPEREERGSRPVANRSPGRFGHRLSRGRRHPGARRDRQGPHHGGKHLDGCCRGAGRRRRSLPGGERLDDHHPDHPRRHQAARGSLPVEKPELPAQDRSRQWGLTPELLKETLGLRTGQIKRFLVENRNPEGSDELLVVLSKVSSQDIAAYPEKLKELDGVRDVSIVKRAKDRPIKPT